MHGVVRRYTGASALADALTKREQEVRDLISGVPGFRAYYAVRSGSSVATITICDDAKGTEESVRRARDWVQKNLSGSNIPAPEVTEGEVFLKF